jgi:hypothetical protein
MATGEHGLLGQPVASLAPVEPSLEPANATIRHRPTEESPVPVLPPDPKRATLKSALWRHQVSFIQRQSKHNNAIWLRKRKAPNPSFYTNIHTM